MKILVLSEAIAGSGHTKAAANLAKGMKLIFPKADIKVDTGLPKVSPFLEKWSSRLYMGTIKHAAPLWGWAYQRDKEWSVVGKNALKKFVSKRLVSYIKEESPDLVVCTHAFCLGGLAELKSSSGFPFRLGAALTDFCVNPFWIFDEVDAYFVGAEPIKKQMIEIFHVQEERIHVTGIPIDPEFSKESDGTALRSQYGIPADSRLVLVSGGGLGLSPYREILKSLSGTQQAFFFVLLSGHNQRARIEAEEWIKQNSFRHPVLVLDYVNNMNEWMKTADLMIGKPGGLTVSEAFACQLPLLIYRPIPGQEERNSRFLLGEQVAMRADHPDELACHLEHFFMEAEERKRLIERIRIYSKPSAAIEAGRILLRL